MYLMYGLDNFLINEEISKISKKNKINELNINKYDYLNTSLNQIIEDLTTVSLFDDQKLVILNNYKNDKDMDDVLLNYLEHKTDNSILILVHNNTKLDTRRKIIKYIEKNGNIVDFNKGINVNKYIIDHFKPYNIDNYVVNHLVDRVGKDIGLLNQSIEKIKIYKDEDLNITKEDIDNLTNKNIDLDIFNLIENIVNKNKDKAIESYNEMIKYGTEPISVLVMLANQFRIIYQSKVLIKEMSEKEIATYLEIHPFRVKKALEKAYKYKEDELLNIIEKFADLDLEIKTGKIDKQIGLELLILSL